MSKHYDVLTIQQYLAGELSPEKSYQLERDALQDPMLQDAIDGFEHSKGISHPALSILQQRLETRVAQQQEKRDHFYFGRQRLAVASIAGVLFILACTLFWMINYPLKKGIPASSKEVSINTLSSIKATLQSGNLAPVIGWKDYNHYLTINNASTSTQEEVSVSFQVVNGRPTSIVANTNDPMANELVKLIQEGPDWKGSEGVVIFK